jgi:hypothetical protein
LGLVRGFQIPARKTFTYDDLRSPLAVALICLADSALHGPAITHGTDSWGNQSSMEATERFSFLAVSLAFFKTVPTSCHNAIFR